MFCSQTIQFFLKKKHSAEFCFYSQTPHRLQTQPQSPSICKHKTDSLSQNNTTNCCEPRYYCFLQFFFNSFLHYLYMFAIYTVYNHLEVGVITCTYYFPSFFYNSFAMSSPYLFFSNSPILFFHTCYYFTSD